MSIVAARERARRRIIMRKATNRLFRVGGHIACRGDGASCKPHVAGEIAWTLPSSNTAASPQSRFFDAVSMPTLRQDVGISARDAAHSPQGQSYPPTMRAA
jgi:hypothetical protein